jgi:radical SAM protein with 4Fe4S-binding SPASM domain
MILARQDATPSNLDVELGELARRMEVGAVDDALYFPKYFQVETTRLCNARCPFCAIDLWDKTTPFMSDDLFRKVADEIIRFRDWVKFVDLQRAGEPLLDVKIYDRVKYMKDGGVRTVAITTNASALNVKNSRKLLEAGIDEVMLSIDSVEKVRYEQMRVGLSYELVMRNITSFFELRNALRPQCLVRVRGVSFHDPENPDDRRDLDAWEAFWSTYRQPHDRIYMKRAHNWGNQKVIELHSPEYHWVFHPCIIPWSTMHITAMGKVALCPQDFDAKADLGDLNRQSIVEVWRGDKIQAMRRLHATGERNQEPMCQGCRIFDEEFSLERDRDKAAPAARAQFDATNVVRKARRLI